MSGVTNTVGGLRIVRLEAENFKRLKAIDITPAPGAATVTIAGRNAQGKSSVIDAIWAALANTAQAKGTGTTRPIRDGEDRATVRVDLGDFTVTRTWSGDKTQLAVTTADGARFTSPQRMLDDLIGRLSFDPLAFASLPPKHQQAQLLDLVDLPFDPDELADERASKFAERTEIGRQQKQLNGQLAGLPPMNNDVGTEERSAARLFARLQNAREQDARWRDAQRDVKSAEQRVAEARSALAEAEDDLAGAHAEMEDLVEVDPQEIVDAEAQIRDLDETNAAIRANQERVRVAESLTAANVKWENLTTELVDLDNQRTNGLAAAQFPIDGLGFDDGGVTYNGVPFTQASAAEQLRVSVAIAMALNPRVRVIRIADGSLLDSGNLALIGEMAADRGYQVWIETVRDAGVDGPGVVIEDGQVM